ncbi:hypothetical protein ACFOSS_03390 [Pseudaeromonas sharmana]|uniref:Uncharacterized protein n=1 Tax=Pseudaeromonas sharmana TaxID=328412 RepID=A0ABV8CKR4_9GAMM
MIRTVSFLLFTILCFECSAHDVKNVDLVLIGEKQSCGDFFDYKHDYENASNTLKKLTNNEKLWSFLFNEKRLMFCDKEARIAFENGVTVMPSNKKQPFDFLLDNALNLYEADKSKECEKNNDCTLANSYIENAALGTTLKKCPHRDLDCLETNLILRGNSKRRAVDLAKLISSWVENPNTVVLASLGTDHFLAMHPETVNFFDNQIKINDIKNGLFLQRDKAIWTMVPSWKITLIFKNLDRAAANMKLAFDYSKKNKTRIYISDYKGMHNVINYSSRAVRSSLINSVVSWGDSNNFKLNVWASSVCKPKERDKVRSYVPWLLAKRELLSKSEKLSFDLYLLGTLSGCYNKSDLRPEHAHLYLSRIVLEDLSEKITLEQIKRDKEIVRKLAEIIPTHIHTLYQFSSDNEGCYSKMLSDIHYLNLQGSKISHLIKVEYDKVFGATNRISGVCKATLKYL